MNDKLSCDKVPQKFSEWLLGMGCPAEKVPSIEKMSQMCRGQYYMVWRSLMEHLEAKDSIREKRLQVFCDDIKMCREKYLFKEHGSNIIVPEELKVWRQQKDIKQQVDEAEYRIAQKIKIQKELQNKIMCKINQQNHIQQQIKDLQRRNWLLQQVANDLTNKKINLDETKSISDSLCSYVDAGDVKDKLDKCLSSAVTQQFPLSNAVASSSLVSQEHENAERDENIKILVKCRGDVLWPHLYEKRASLVEKLASENTKQHHDIIANKITPQTILAHTAALHASLSLQAMKNKLQLQHTRERFAAAIDDLNNYISGESCELLVLRCEKARSEARVKSLKSLLTELSEGSGVFSVQGHGDNMEATPKEIASIDKCIVYSRDKLKLLISTLVTTERKINNIKECLVGVFKSFHSDGAVDEVFRGVLLDFPKEPMPILKQFFTDRCGPLKDDTLSMELEVSDCSYGEAIDSSPRFVDELKIYLKKFNLENNRKLVLDDGEKIWSFETNRVLYSKLINVLSVSDLTILYPPLLPGRAFKQLIDDVHEINVLESLIKDFNAKEVSAFNIDIKSIITKEENASDKIKKSLSENSNLLAKINKTLDSSREDLLFWSESNLKRFISDNRSVAGKTYKEYETLYLESIALNS
ncbi:uncharacterized protein LOC116775413 [Danaus plexippus]|uniref:uncharacterized protein LOC116775413 n=1 Tax=Danaus plexippus TaxID=13037 RepID=UPI002AB002A6|nr:uncharacterized protein LOC116775413 [Danaus plexippus]